MNSKGNQRWSGLKERWRNFSGLFLLRPAVRIVLFLFLLPVFFVLHGNNENYDIIPTSILWGLLVKYLLITLSVICFSLLAFKTPTKAFLFSLYLMLWYFFFGAFYDTLLRWFPGSRIYSYTFLLPFIGILTLVVFFLLHRSRSWFRPLAKYARLALLCFVLVEIGTFGYNVLAHKEKENDISGKFKLPMGSADSCSNTRPPDIFFVVFDGYTSSSLLKSDFDYDNSAIDSLFRQNGFFLSAASNSNYNYTAFSLASTFNLDYLKPAVEIGYVYPKEVLQAVTTLEKSSLMYFLEKRGYSFLNLGRFQTELMPSEESAFFDFFYADLLDNQTIYSRIRKNIGWKLTGLNVFTGKFAVPARFIRNRKAHLDRNMRNYQRLLQQMNVSSPKPRFVYAHVILPHEPFYLKHDGTMNPSVDVLFQRLDNKQAYLEQVTYANQWLSNIIKMANRPTGRDKVIIIEGDHGYRFWDNDNLMKEFPNLNAYYFSDKKYDSLYDGISPVNSFRIVLNKYFCQQLPMLKDSSLYLKKPGQ